jgi:hypothetical protein
MKNIELTNMKTIIESINLKNINDIFNNPIFDDYYIKTWNIFNSNHFKELWDLQTIINNYYA